jgi:chaperonin GroEL (HSP60 family)
MSFMPFQMGDSTNMVIILAGELLKKAEHLLVMGLHPSEIIKGYELACVKAITELESMFIFLKVTHFILSLPQAFQRYLFQPHLP